MSQSEFEQVKSVLDTLRAKWISQIERRVGTSYRQGWTDGLNAAVRDVDWCLERLAEQLPPAPV